MQSPRISGDDLSILKVHADDDNGPNSGRLDQNDVAATGTAVLPQELVDKVIDGLRHDRSTLMACALTRRAWLHRSRVHLHRSVTLYHQHCRIHPSQIENALSLLSLPVISKYTTHLVLEGKTDYGQRDEKTNREENEELFWRIIDQFSHVTSLRATRLFWVTHSLENKRRLCRVFSSITTLDVYMSDFADLEEFLSFLASFQGLVNLRAERVLWCKNAEEWFGQPGSEPSSYLALSSGARVGIDLRNLKVQHCNVQIMTDIAKWLGSTSAIRVEQLHLSPPDGDDFGALSLYCRATYTSLKHLILDVDFAIKEDTLQHAVIGLELLTELESITLSANFGFGRKFVPAASIFWPCVLVVLKQTATNRLHTMRFECQLEDLVESALVQLDELLSCSQFSRLADVSFALADGGNPGILDVAVHAALPRTASRGILRGVPMLT